MDFAPVLQAKIADFSAIPLESLLFAVFQSFKPKYLPVIRALCGL